MGKIKKLSSDWEKEVETFLEENKWENAGLSVYDTIAGLCMEVDCNYSDILDVIKYIYHVEHSVPEIISYNEITNSVVVNMPLVKGNLEGCRIYKWEKEGLTDITSSILSEEAIEDIKSIIDSLMDYI